MADKPEPHPKNVPGPFYVENGCCLACDIPMTEAPGHFKYDDEIHCYVSRQPQTDEETTTMIATARASEVQCIRYRGTDPSVLRRLAELDLRDICDNQPPVHVKPVIRNHVKITLVGTHAVATPRQLLQEFLDHFVSESHEFQHFKVRKIRTSTESSAAEISWYEDYFHPILFTSVPGSPNQFHIEYPLKNRGVGDVISEWLERNSNRFTNIRWYTDDDWRSGGPSQSTLW